MLCLLFFCRLVFCLGKAAAPIRRAARTGQRSRSYRAAKEARQSAGPLVFVFWKGRLRKAAKMARAAPFPFVYILERRRRRSEERHEQDGKRGTAKRRASCFLYIGKDACAKRRKWRGLRRSPSFYYFVNVSRPYRQAISGRTRAAMTAARTPRRMSLLPGRNTQPTSVAQMPTSLCRYNSAMRK